MAKLLLHINPDVYENEMHSVGNVNKFYSCKKRENFPEQYRPTHIKKTMTQEKKPMTAVLIFSGFKVSVSKRTFFVVFRA